MAMFRVPYMLDGRLSRDQCNRLKLAFYGGLAVVLAVLAAVEQATGIAISWQGVLADAAAVIFLLNLIPNILRLHDRGKSGWWLLVFSGLPWLILGAVTLGLSLLPDHPPLELALTISIVTLTLLFCTIGLMVWGAVELTFRKGTPGPNQFGPPSEADPIGDLLRRAPETPWLRSDA